MHINISKVENDSGYLARDFLVHLNQRSMWTIAITWRPSSVVCRLSSVVCCLSSVNFSHFKILLRNHLADWNQTWQKCSLDGHIQDFCFWHWSEIQHGCQVHNVFWLVEILKIFLLETTKPIELWLCRNDHWVVCTKLVNRLLIGNSRWPPWLDLILT